MIPLLIVIACGIAVIVLGIMTIRDMRKARRHWAEAAANWERARVNWEETARIYKGLAQRQPRLPLNHRPW